METFLLIARLILAIVFAVAGIAKLFDLNGSRKAVAGFGVPENLANLIGVALPVVEIAAAILLLPLATAWAGAVAASVLLGAFIAGIAYNMIQGRAPDCHCFGQIHSEPVGRSVLVRNLVLLAMAVFVIVVGRENVGLSAFAWVFDLTTAWQMQLVFNVAFVGLLAAAIYYLRQVLRGQTVVQRQIEMMRLVGASGDDEDSTPTDTREVAPIRQGLPVGAVAPEFAAADLNNRNITLENLLLRGKPILLFFVSPTCQPCQALIPSFEQWQNELGDKFSIVLISSGAAKANREKYGAGNLTVLLQKDRETAELFQAAWTPSAVLINTDGTIGSELTNGDRAVFNLIDEIKAKLPQATNGNGHVAENYFILPKRKRETFAPRAGEFAPNFTLPSLDGREISLSDYRGMKTLLLFWRATCPFCSAMIDDLQKLESNLHDYKLLILANDEPEIERAKAFQSTVLIESNQTAQRLYDLDATPAGIIIDENGKIASDVVVGADDVFALVGFNRKN